MHKKVNSEEHWIHGMHRLLHLDSHFGHFKEIYKDFDAEATAQRYADMGFQMVSFMATDGPSYYPTQIGKMHAGLKRDFVGEFTRALKKHGIKCIVYFGFFDIGFDFERLETKAIPQLIELIDLYDVDGFFIDGPSQSFLRAPASSPLCRRLYENEVGGEFPDGDDHPNAFRFRRWANGYLDALHEKTTNAVLERKPDALLIYNGSWMLRYPVTPPRSIHLLQWDVATPASEGVYACSYSLEGRYLATYEDRSFGMNNVRGINWIDYSLREPEAFMHESALLLAGGGKPYLSDNPSPSGNPDPALTEIYEKVNRQTRELEPYLTDAFPVKDVAILHSADSIWSKAPYCPVTAWIPSPAYHPVAGAHKALVEGHVQILIPNSETLLKTLDEYNAVVLADQRILSPEQSELIRSFVESGGTLIATCESGTRDLDNKPLDNFALADVLGVNYRETAPMSVGYLRIPRRQDDYGIPATDIPVVGSYVRVETTTAKTLIDLVGPYERTSSGNPPPAVDAEGPGITVNSFGKGKAVYCTSRLFDAYYKQDIPLLRKIGLWMLDQAYPRNMRSVAVESAPINVEVFLNRRGEDRFVHLVNYSADKREGHVPQVQDFHPVYGIKIRVRLPEKPTRIMLVPEKREITYSFQNGYALFEAEPLLIHSAYWIQGGESQKAG